MFYSLIVFQSASSPYCVKMSCLRLQVTERLFQSFVFLHSFGVFFILKNNNSRENFAETLTQFGVSPKAPHMHRRTPQVFPELIDAENYCRNPGGENERPWCYTKDPAVTWEYCSVFPCGDGRQLHFIISATVVILFAS